MNRPRNRQPRPPRQDQTQGRGGRGQGGRGGSLRSTLSSGSVPTTHQVVPGAGVFIVLKEDQPTGHETAGVVQDILTRGNHPRGIKVRLRDGQVGRVQRMSATAAPAGSVASAAAGDDAEQTTTANKSTRFSHRYVDVRLDDEYPSEPPARSLADFIPATSDADATETCASGDVSFAQASITCPFCDAFDGDETAVTHHIDQVHLT